MKITLPFIDKTLYLGKKEVAAAKQRLIYGFYQNSLGDLTGLSTTRINFKTLYELYNKIVDIKQAIKKIQNTCAREGFKIVDINEPEKEGDKTQTEIAMNVLDHKNSPFVHWKNSWVRDRHVAGNHYLHIEKTASNEPIRLVSVDPRTMVIIANKYGDIIKYTQGMAGHDLINFDSEEIVHSPFDQSTQNPILGCSPIEAIVVEAQTEMAAQVSNYAFYENHGVPAHLLIVDGELTKEQHIELKHQLESKFKGAENRFKTGIIPFVKDIKTITPTQKDMQYLETRWLTTKKIVVAFGVDAFILGYTDKVQRGNADVIYRMFYENTIRPQEIELENIINRNLFPKLGLDKIKFIINPSNYDDKQEIADITRNDVLAGIITINEARGARGLPESDNELADEHLFQGFLIDDLENEFREIREFAEKKIGDKRRTLYNLLNNE